VTYRANGMSSKPTTDTAPGTAIPASVSALIRPIATRSLNARTPVTPDAAMAAAASKPSAKFTPHPRVSTVRSG
jgi:hypothetical protein